MKNNRPKILFLCVANSARSQLAEGLAKGLLNADIHSAGSAPANQIHSLATEVLKEKGIDISAHKPKSIDSLARSLTDPLDFIITLCAEEQCPVLQNSAQKIHWPLSDPAERGIEAFRQTRDDIEQRLRKFGSENNCLKLRA